MRLLLLCVVISVLGTAIAAPTATADEALPTGGATSGDGATSGGATSTSGPDPSACRPYCMSA